MGATNLTLICRTVTKDTVVYVYLFSLGLIGEKFIYVYLFINQAKFKLKFIPKNRFG